MSTRYVWGRYNTKTIFKNLGNSTAGIWMGTNGKPESTNIIVPNPDGDGEIYGLGGSGIENGQYKYWIIKTYPDLLPTAGEEEGSFGWSNLWASDYILGGTITVDTTAEQILDTINITDRDFINAKHVFVIITPATINSLSRVSFLCKAYRRNLDVFSMIMRGSIKTMTIGYFPSGEFYDRGLCYKNGNLGAVSFYFCNTNDKF